MSGRHKPKLKKIRHCIGYTSASGILVPCGVDISYLHHNAVRCPECQRLDRIFKKILAAEVQREKDDRLGTSYLGPHMKKKSNGEPDWLKELAAIKRERKRLELD